MTNRIYLAGIVERGGRILLVRPTPAAPWELPGGPLLQRHPDADVAMGEILEAFGLTVPAIAEGFIETLYLPDSDGHLVYNLYHAAEWEGDPEIPIGMGAGWYALDELDAVPMREEVRAAVLVAYGLREPANQDAAILHAMAGAATDPAAVQPPLGAIPPFEDAPADGAGSAGEASLWSRPGSAATADAPGTEGPTIGADSPAAAIAAADGDGSAPEAGSSVPTTEEPTADPDAGSVAPEAGDDETADAKVLQFPVQAADVPGDLIALDVEDEHDLSDLDLNDIFEPEIELIAQDGDGADEATVIDFEIGGASPGRSAQASATNGTEEAVARRLRGFDVLRTLRGGADPLAAYEDMRGRMPELAEDILEFGLGDLWSNPRLDRRTRSLQVVAMLAALGGRTGPLRTHLSGALNHGATPDEIVETLRMVAGYAGFPAAVEAWATMEEVFRAHGVKPEGRS